MNDQRLIADFTPPPMSGDLQRALRVLTYRTENAIQEPPEHHPEAERWLALYRAQIKPTTPEMVRAWVSDLAMHVPMPRAGQSIGIAARAGGILMACGTFPAACWTRETLTLALQTFKWFPTSSEVYELLKPIANKIKATLAGLEALANAKPSERAVPAREPYQPPPAPDWAFDRTMRGSLGYRTLNIQPPLRTVEEQIALLKAG